MDKTKKSYINGCKKKRTFESWHAAEFVTTAAGFNHLPYKCVFCKKWHLTSKRGSDTDVLRKTVKNDNPSSVK